MPDQVSWRSIIYRNTSQYSRAGVADKTLRIYAYNPLHFVRWWESVHHTGEVRETDLTEATLRE